MTPHVAVCVALLALGPSLVSAQSGAHRIVQVEAEDAVNIIQQKSAGVLTTGDIDDSPTGAQVRGSVQASITLRATGGR